jgi:putative SOS response-associated peptidase YedK
MAVTGGGGGVLTMAGLWETWNPAGRDAGVGASPLRTATILTTDASGPLAAIHHRMPVFLEGEAQEIWLDPAATIEQLETAIRRQGIAALVATEISRAVNKPEHDDPSILEAAPESPGDSGLLF